MAYIYKITNDINNKIYIGKTEFSIEKRFNEHIRDSKKRRQERRPLYNAINKYGEEHFSISLVEKVSSDIASEREKYWISFYDSYNNGYNATLGGDGKIYLNYKKILSLYDNTSLSQKDIAKECNCTVDSVRNIVSQYRDNINWYTRASKQSKSLLGKPIKVRCIETQEEFDSCSKAGKWLVSKGKIKSSNYGKNGIAQAIQGKRNTVGGYRWEKIN